VWLEVAPEVELKLSRDAIHGRTPAAAHSDADDGADEADDDTDEERD
jgi:hypothetical protein